MGGWLAGCMDVWQAGWRDGWMDVWLVDGWMNGWMAGWLDGWRDGWVDGWMDSWMDVCACLLRGEYWSATAAEDIDATERHWASFYQAEYQ